MSTSQEQLVSERIEPVAPTFSTARMSTGEPGLPERFRWRGREFAVAEVIQTWKESGPCRSGADEMYLRKHWYHVRTTDGSAMKIYFDRQPRRGQSPARRWWLYTVATGA